MPFAVSCLAGTCLGGACPRVSPASVLRAKSRVKLRLWTEFLLRLAPAAGSGGTLNEDVEFFLLYRLGGVGSDLFCSCGDLTGAGPGAGLGAGTTLVLRLRPKPVSTFDLTCENSGSLYTLKAAVWVADLRGAASAPELW